MFKSINNGEMDAEFPKTKPQTAVVDQVNYWVNGKSSHWSSAVNKFVTKVKGEKKAWTNKETG